MKTTKTKEKKYRFNFKKLLKNIIKLMIGIIVLLVVLKRIQEIDSLTWFITTWN